MKRNKTNRNDKTDERTDGRPYGRTDDNIDKCIHISARIEIDGWTDVRKTNRWMDGWMDAETDWWTDVRNDCQADERTVTLPNGWMGGCAKRLAGGWIYGWTITLTGGRMCGTTARWMNGRQHCQMHGWI